MQFEEFIKRAFASAEHLGCTAAETYSVESEAFSAMVIEQELDSYTVSRQRGIGLRVQNNGRDGYAYTEVLEDPEALARRAADNATSIGRQEDHPMQSASAYEEVAQPENPAFYLGEKEKIGLAMELEQRAKEADPRVDRVSGAQVSTARSIVRIDNTLGLAARRESIECVSYVSPIMLQGSEVHEGSAFRLGKDILDVEGCAREAVEKTAAQFGASPVPPGKYRALLEAEAAGDLLESFSPMFSAENAQKGLSLLAGREGQAVASPSVCIVDDPFYAGRPLAFDAEGTPSVSFPVVDQGTLTTLLHNLKTAKKAGVATTANASRASAVSPVKVAPTNFFVRPGSRDFQDMIKDLEHGLVITDISGLHAGVNPVSGDFSLLAKGLLVEKGVVVRPVEQITVAGNYLSLLKNVEEVGADLRFGFPGVSWIGSPSLLITELMVAG